MHRLFVTAGIATVVSVAGVVYAQPPLPPPAVEHRPTIVLPDRHDITAPLRDMPVIPPGLEREASPHAPLPIRGGPRTSPGPQDGALQTTAPGTHGFVAPNGFEGIGNNDGVLPPDTNGDVGPNHYIQWVNLSFAIFDKQGHVLQGPMSGRTLWNGFGGPCEADNDGDPIVLYDKAADRWFMSQFALPNYPSGPFYQCIAVSQSPDPQGSWARYSYSFSKMNDYPKFGVWSDGYYMSINQFSGNSWAGQGVAVFERAKMLAGQPARMVYFDMASVDGSLGGMLPADIDGLAPPTNSPEYYMQFDDVPTELQLWQFKVNWTTPSASTFTRKALLATNSFNSNMCNGSRNCIPQPGTRVRIDAIADRLMYRLQYRHFADGHESLVTNHTVNVGSNRGGVRWYEIQDPGGSPHIVQQGTFAPADSLNRWMGSVAMDKYGNLGVGYSVSSSTVFPSIRFSGRLAGDPAGTLTVAESDLQTGSGYQSHTSGRWGDYSMLAVDPTDDCTFWYTTEYYTSGATSAGWRTSIGSFKLGACGGGTVTAPAAPSGLGATAASSSQINLTWADNSNNETGFELERCAGASCSAFTLLTTTGSGVTSYSDTNLAASTSYSYRVRAVNSAGQSNYSNIATATTQPAATAEVWVTALTGSAAANGKNAWRATATITAGNGNGSASGVTVTGTWSDGSTGSCVTGTSGSCNISSASLSKRVSSTVFTIKSLSSATLVYNASKNATTSVKILKP